MKPDDVLTHRELVNIAENINNERMIFMTALVEISLLKDEPRAVEIARRALSQSAEEFGTT